MDLTPMLASTSGTPLYMQLYRYLRDRIEDGVLAEGERLPSIRQLSAHLRISKNTVETVYQQLLAEGYVESKPRSGLFVLPLEDAAGGVMFPPERERGTEAAYADLSRTQRYRAAEDAAAGSQGSASAVAGTRRGMKRPLKAYSRWGSASPGAASPGTAGTAPVPAGAAHIGSAAPGPNAPAASGSRPDAATARADTPPGAAAPSAHPAARIDFEYGEIDTSHFPLKSWRKCLSEAVLSDAAVLGYGDPQGNAELRREIAGYLFRSRGVNCSPDQVFLFAGTQQAIGFMCRLLPLVGRAVAIEEPGYDGAREMLRQHGCELLPVPLDADGISLGGLRASRAQAVYVTPSHQYPMGMVLPVQKRAMLLQWAVERDGYILEDDYDSEFRYQGHPIPALKSLDHADRVIYLGTFSKSFLPAARLSYAVVPQSLAPRFREGAGSCSQTVSPIIQQAMLSFMQGGQFGRHVRRMRRLYQTKHRAMLEAIGRYMGGKVDVIGQKAGLHLLLDIPGRRFDELADRAAGRGVTVYSPMKHWQNKGACPPSHVVLGFGGIGTDEIDEGIRLLAEAWFGNAARTD